MNINQQQTRSWCYAPKNITLSEYQVHVWRIPLECSEFTELDPKWLQLLSTEEYERGSRLVKSVLRQRFWLAHAIVRLILARYDGVATAELRFYTGEHGKPYLLDSTLQFNLSHSHDQMLLAVARDIELGADIEYMRQTIEVEDLAQRFFSPIEVSSLRKVTPAERKLGFYRLWSRKEAYIKAIGKGLSYPLHNFSVSLEDTEGNCLLAIENDAEEAKKWSLLGLGEVNDYVMALAYRGQDYELHCWTMAGEDLFISRIGF